MFSFQYPDPKKNYPYYHCEDPEEFMEKSHEIYEYDNDYKRYSSPVNDTIDDDESVCSATEIEDGFRYTTIDTDKTFILNRLTKENILRKRTEMIKKMEEEDCVNVDATTTISSSLLNTTPTNPWVNKDVIQISPTFEQIVQEQKTEEEENKRKSTTINVREVRPEDASSEYSSASHSSSTEKSRLCIYGKNCKNTKQCSRSHTFDEWQPNICRYNKRCRNNKCLYYHEGDNKNSYLSNIINSSKEQMKFYSKNKTMYIKNYKLDD